MLVKVPASTANLGPGFDSIGMALSLYLTLKIKQSDHTRFYLRGENGRGLPADKSNLIYRTIEFLFDKIGKKAPELEIEVDSEIPLARGLGSSGAAITGGLAAANLLAGEPFSKDELFQMAAKIEGHPDNVGASMFGGIIIAAKNDLGNYTYVRLDAPANLGVAVAIPDFELKTKQARGVLPDKYTKEDVVHAISHSALLAGALARGDLAALRTALDDRIHQPYRAQLLPGFEEIRKNCRSHGALGAVISGAGPSMLAFTDGDPAEVTVYMDSVLKKHGIKAAVTGLDIDNYGITFSLNKKMAVNEG